MKDEDKVKIFNCAYNYLYGTLWWGREALILEHIPNWKDSGRYGHPLLSLRKTPVKQVFEAIPMLAGTSGKGKLTIHMNGEDENITTNFGTATCSVGITAEDFLWHSDKYEDQPETPVSKRRRIWQAHPKKRISAAEENLLDEFLKTRRFAALKNGGYNHE